MVSWLWKTPTFPMNIWKKFAKSNGQHHVVYFINSRKWILEIDNGIRYRTGWKTTIHVGSLDSNFLLAASSYSLLRQRWKWFTHKDSTQVSLSLSFSSLYSHLHFFLFISSLIRTHLQFFRSTASNFGYFFCWNCQVLIFRWPFTMLVLIFFCL